jgi:hypothetical protein
VDSTDLTNYKRECQLAAIEDVNTGVWTWDEVCINECDCFDVDGNGIGECLMTGFSANVPPCQCQ